MLGTYQIFWQEMPSRIWKRICWRLLRNGGKGGGRRGREVAIIPCLRRAGCRNERERAEVNRFVGGSFYPPRPDLFPREYTHGHHFHFATTPCELLVSIYCPPYGWCPPMERPGTEDEGSASSCKSFCPMSIFDIFRACWWSRLLWTILPSDGELKELCRSDDGLNLA